MKIVTLNIMHGGGGRVAQILEYLIQHDADVVVLTEFKENKNAAVLRYKLAAQGLVHFAAASNAPNQNSVCIFSRLPFEPGRYPALAPDDVHRVISAHFDEIVVYGVYFPQRKAKASLFQFFIDADKSAEDALMVVGDFNTGLHRKDEKGSTFHCADLFAALPKAGLIDSWRSRNQEEKVFSWYSNVGNGFRIDHVFSSPSADKNIQGVYYDHTPRETRITDHSAMVIEYAT